MNLNIPKRYLGVIENSTWVQAVAAIHAEYGNPLYTFNKHYEFFTARPRLDEFFRIYTGRWAEAAHQADRDENDNLTYDNARVSLCRYNRREPYNREHHCQEYWDARRSNANNFNNNGQHIRNRTVRVTQTPSQPSSTSSLTQRNRDILGEIQPGRLEYMDFTAEQVFELVSTGASRKFVTPTLV